MKRVFRFLLNRRNQSLLLFSLLFFIISIWNPPFIKYSRSYITHVVSFALRDDHRVKETNLISYSMQWQLQELQFTHFVENCHREGTFQKVNISNQLYNSLPSKTTPSPQAWLTALVNDDFVLPAI
eukprot:Sdes_comp17576_c1_seq1m6825